jgi:cytochrome c oxidase cbb3-type subunit III
MPTKIEKDALSGRETTGHEWDGLKELNNPLPKWWVYVLFATIAWAIVWFLLFPIPVITGNTAGLLHYAARADVAAAVKALADKRAVYMDKIAATPIADVKKDPQLLAMATTAGRITFANNCAPCHGAGGEGRVGYPNLADDVWIWGGKLGDIETTITHGVRSGDPDARTSAMPRFGADGLLKPEQIQQVADYVMTLYGHGETGKDVAAGNALFAKNCVACHGENGEGNRDAGGPPLKSQVHLYGDTRAVVVSQITNPRQGVMPNWSPRLDKATIRSVAIYVHDLGGGE